MLLSLVDNEIVVEDEGSFMGVWNVGGGDCVVRFAFEEHMVDELQIFVDELRDVLGS